MEKQHIPPVPPTNAEPHRKKPSRLLRLREVLDRVSVGRSSLYAMIQRGEFPKQRRVSRACVAWLESEVEDWIARRQYV